MEKGEKIPELLFGLFSHGLSRLSHVEIRKLVLGEREMNMKLGGNKFR